jgi:TolB protein
MTMIRLARFLLTLVFLPLFAAGAALAQNGPLRLEITEGVIEPLPFAVPDFVAQNGEASQYAGNLARVIAADLTGSGLFREIPAQAHISKITDFAASVQFADWRAINASALITGAVTVSGGNITVMFRVYDVVSGAELGNGLRFAGPVEGWRRMAHKGSDAVYSRITGEGG